LTRAPEPVATISAADALIIERAQKDLEEGIDHTRARIRASHPNPFVWRPMEAAVNAAISGLQLRSRYRDDVKFLLSLAHRVADGADPVAIADENLARAIHLRELSVVVREKDPEFAPMLVKAKQQFALRLPDLARMVRVADATSYVEIVRKAFPDRKEVEALVASNRLYTLEMVEHLERHPHLLRVPHSWIPRFGDLSREIIDWQTKKILDSLDEIYA
jgi:hypothetical protein